MSVNDAVQYVLSEIKTQQYKGESERYLDCCLGIGSVSLWWLHGDSSTWTPGCMGNSQPAPPTLRRNQPGDVTRAGWPRSSVGRRFWESLAHLQTLHNNHTKCTSLQNNLSVTDYSHSIAQQADTDLVMWWELVLVFNEVTQRYWTTVLGAVCLQGVPLHFVAIGMNALASVKWIVNMNINLVY